MSKPHSFPRVLGLLSVFGEEVAFKNFLKSVQFAADGGATDGHK